MPKAKENVSVEKPEESDEKVDFGEDNDLEEETMEEEEVEYEEVDEEEEFEEIEEDEDVEEEVEEEEEEEADDADVDSARDDMDNNHDEEQKKHAELLALPPNGSEVYIGGIPHDISDNDLKVFCESVGEVTEVRIMKGKDSVENKGFAFVTFRSVKLATKAIDELNNKELKGRKIKCSSSQAKHKLFVGNVPRSWKDEDLMKAVKKVGPGVTTVELVKDIKNTGINRGFAFVDYYNHQCAEYSRQKMTNPLFKLENNTPTVSWADPKNAESSQSSASQVKAVYVKNLPKNVTQDQLKKLFEHHGKITKAILPAAKAGHEKNRIGFVHFADKSSAMKALRDTEKYELDGQVLECSLAKPQSDQKPSGGTSSHGSGLLPTYPPHGYGLVGGPYGGLSSGYGAAGFAPPMMYGRGPSPGMAMMPMLLPDGRIGYVLQQPPGLQPHHQLTPHTPPPSHHRNNTKSSHGGGSRSGGSGGGGGQSSSNSRGKHGGDSRQGGRRYRPY